MNIQIDSRYPSIDDLRNRARKRIPSFAFEYLDGGCNEDVNLRRNREDLQAVELMPRYLYSDGNYNTKATLFGQEYSAPFGIAPIGLQGLMWPKAPEILAKAAFDHNIPFILSTVTTAGIERIAEITQGQAWFQLYHPTDPELRDDILRRAAKAGIQTLVILADVPTFGFRPRDVRNGLAMPPKMTVKNMVQIATHPNWALRTLFHGQPNFETLVPYMKKGMNLKQLGKFMDQTFSGRLDRERVGKLRELWKGNLVLKGVVSEEDMDMAIELGLDGIIVSNHGGRQLDAGESTIVPLKRLVARYKGKISIMMDSGIRGGPDVARAIACGADFVFLGRSFMYGVAALGDQGGNHTISLLKIEFQQIMQQLGCSSIDQLPSHLIRK